MAKQTYLQAKAEQVARFDSPAFEWKPSSGLTKKEWFFDQATRQAEWQGQIRFKAADNRGCHTWPSFDLFSTVDLILQWATDKIGEKLTHSEFEALLRNITDTYLDEVHGGLRMLCPEHSHINLTVVMS